MFWQVVVCFVPLRNFLAFDVLFEPEFTAFLAAAPIDQCRDHSDDNAQGQR
jgi:hypothetical protein